MPAGLAVADQSWTCKEQLLHCLALHHLLVACHSVLREHMQCTHALVQVLWVVCMHVCAGHRLPNSVLSLDAGGADGTANGLIMMNSNGMDVTLTNDTMRFSITGGVLDMYFLMGPSPFDVNDQLTQVVGRPVMPPYWSMGFMNSKCDPPPPPHLAASAPPILFA